MICENCEATYTEIYGSGRFCSSKCARGFSTKSKRAEINDKVSQALRGKPTVGMAIMQQPRFKKIAKEKQTTYYAEKPFDEVGKSVKKKRIIKEQGGSCNRCKLDTWLGEPLILELEHKDGNSQNDVRDNLECLCPNCHSLTETWRGRNIAFRKGVSDEEMIKLLRETGSMHKTLIRLGLAPKGGNYKRTNRLVAEHNIDLFASRAFKMTQEEIQKAKELKKSGLSNYKIAAAMGFARSTIAIALRKMED